MKQLFTLKDLLQEQLRDLYDAEVQYSYLLPNLVATATSSELRRQLEEVLVQTNENASTLARACEALGAIPTGVSCEAMNGLVREAKDTTLDWGDTATIDAALISNAQRIVHYEIAGFGTAREFARCIREKDIAEDLTIMLRKSAENDRAFTRIATGGWFTTGINKEAADLAA